MLVSCASLVAVVALNGMGNEILADEELAKGFGIALFTLLGAPKVFEGGGLLCAALLKGFELVPLVVRLLVAVPNGLGACAKGLKGFCEFKAPVLGAPNVVLVDGEDSRLALCFGCCSGGDANRTLLFVNLPRLVPRPPRPFTTSLSCPLCSLFAAFSTRSFSKGSLLFVLNAVPRICSLSVSTQRYRVVGSALSSLIEATVFLMT